MNRPTPYAALILLVLAGGGCTKSAEDTKPNNKNTTTAVGEGISYADAAKHSVLVDALTRAKIPHTVEQHGGQPTVSWRADQSVRVLEVQTQLFGDPLPSGRNLAADPVLQAQFEAWLKERSISYRIQHNEGRPYIVWEEKDTPQVQTWPYFPPPLKERP